MWLRRQRVCQQCGRPEFDLWVGKIPWRTKWQPTPVLLPGKSHGQRSPVGYSPWGRQESDTTERLHFLLSFFRGLGANEDAAAWDLDKRGLYRVQEAQASLAESLSSSRSLAWGSRADRPEGGRLRLRLPGSPLPRPRLSCRLSSGFPRFRVTFTLCAAVYACESPPCSPLPAGNHWPVVYIVRLFLCVIVIHRSYLLKMRLY